MQRSFAKVFPEKLLESGEGASNRPTVEAANAKKGFKFEPRGCIFKWFEDSTKMMVVARQSNTEPENRKLQLKLEAGQESKQLKQ